jgi:hypothetical protein
MHARSAPVVRLEGPLALGHDVLLILSRLKHSQPPGRSRVSIGLVCESVGGGRAAGRRGPRAYHPRSQPYRRLSGDCLRVLTSLPLVKPGLAQRPRSAMVSMFAVQHNGQPQQTESGPANPNQSDWNAAELLAAARKTVSFSHVVLDWNDARQRSEDGRSTSWLDDLLGFSSARRSRAVAGRLRLAYDHPVHICA